MSITLQIEHLLLNTKPDETLQAFQLQYDEMLMKGFIQRKEYNLAGVNVIGDKPKSIQNYPTIEMAMFSRTN